MPPSNVVRLRKVCLSLPEVTEVEAWGEPTFRVGKIFAMYAGKVRHGGGREGVWVKSKNFTQDLLVRGMPQRFFVPPYVGPAGWTGVYLDAQTDWEALAELLRDAYRMTASKRLTLLLDAADPSPTPTKARKKSLAKKRTSKNVKSAKRTR